MFRTAINKVVAQTADVAEGTLTTPIDVPGCVVDVPRAGTYSVYATGSMTADSGTSRSVGFGVQVVGASPSFNLGFCRAGTSTGALQADNTTLSAFTGTATSLFVVEFDGYIVVPGPCRLQLRFSRSATLITFSGCVLVVHEAV